MAARGNRSLQSGFSIIELMIVISIIGVLAAIGIPAFNDMIKNNRRTVVVNELIANLSLARAEGAKRNQPVSVCAHGGGTTCAGSAKTNWSYGWMVFVDINDNGEPDDPGDWVDLDNDGAVDPGESPVVLRSYTNDYSDIRVTSFGAGPVVIRSINQTSSNGTITVCDKRGASKARAVVISGNGRARTAINNVEDPVNGVALVCPS